MGVAEMMMCNNPGNLITFAASCLFLRNYKPRDFHKEIGRLMIEFGSAAPNGLTVLNGSLYLKWEKNLFYGNVVAFGEKAKRYVARNLWLDRMMQYAKASPPRSGVWLEQGIFYYLDDFEVILPPFAVQCGNLSESYHSSAEVIGATRAQKTYDQLLQEPWRLTPEDYSYREDPDFVLRCNPSVIPSI